MANILESGTRTIAWRTSWPPSSSWCSSTSWTRWWIVAGVGFPIPCPIQNEGTPVTMTNLAWGVVLRRRPRRGQEAPRVWKTARAGKARKDPRRTWWPRSRRLGLGKARTLTKRPGIAIVISCRAHSYPEIVAVVCWPSSRSACLNSPVVITIYYTIICFTISFTWCITHKLSDFAVNHEQYNSNTNPESIILSRHAVYNWLLNANAASGLRNLVILRHAAELRRSRRALQEAKCALRYLLGNLWEDLPSPSRVLWGNSRTVSSQDSREEFVRAVTQRLPQKVRIDHQGHFRVSARVYRKYAPRPRWHDYPYDSRHALESGGL